MALVKVSDLKASGQDYLLPLPTSVLCRDQMTSILSQPFVPAWQPFGAGPKYIFQIGTWEDHVSTDAFYDVLGWTVILPTKREIC